MKLIVKFILLFAVLGLGLTSCSEPGTDAQSGKTTDTPVNEAPENIPSVNVGKTVNPDVGSTITAYLQLKEALTSDNSKEASAAGKTLGAALAAIDPQVLDAAKAAEIADILSTSREHASHIVENRGNLEHQRSHFDDLSLDMIALIEIAGTDRPLYETYCPMYNKGKGGTWLSSTQEVQNPFFGASMLNCGKVMKEFAAN